MATIERGIFTHRWTGSSYSVVKPKESLTVAP
jgi:hypothetical protein